MQFTRHLVAMATVHPRRTPTFVHLRGNGKEANGGDALKENSKNRHKQNSMDANCTLRINQLSPIVASGMYENIFRI